MTARASSLATETGWWQVGDRLSRIMGCTLRRRSGIPAGDALKDMRAVTVADSWPPSAILGPVFRWPPEVL
jgi:hypothetical protein